MLATSGCAAYERCASEPDFPKTPVQEVTGTAVTLAREPDPRTRLRQHLLSLGSPIAQWTMC